jgi:hypothetical protein
MPEDKTPQASEEMTAREPIDGEAPLTRVELRSVLLAAECEEDRKRAREQAENRTRSINGTRRF